MFFLSSADFFSRSTFPKKIFQEYHQSVNSDQARHFVGLNWVQIVCKVYRQTTLERKDLIKESIYAYPIST